MAITTKKGSAAGPDVQRDTTITNTAVRAYNGFCELTGWNIQNPNTSIVYLKFWDQAAAPTVGTTIPDKTLEIPGSTTLYMEHETNRSQGTFDKALWYAAVTGRGDTDNTAPTTAVYAEIYYKP